MLIPIILAGGSGSRLWPQSREHAPKPLVAFIGKDTLLQQTIRRLPAQSSEPMIVCNALYVLSAWHQVRALNLKPLTFLAEPVPRGTLAALAISCVAALEICRDAVVLVLPADHAMKKPQYWHAMIPEMMSAAEKKKLVVFGVTPDRPSSEYGYICANEQQQISCFVEKPSLAKAKELLEHKALWNAGMFALRADACEYFLKFKYPELWKNAQKAYNSDKTDQYNICRIDSSFNDLPNDTIDYGIAEHILPEDSHVIRLPSECGWSDVGTWESIYDWMPHDDNHNALQGKPIAVDCQNTLVRTDGRPVITLGLKDTAVVVDKDAVLVAARSHLSHLKDAVKEMAINPSRPTEDMLNCRQWGYYYTYTETANYGVKILHVEPKKNLSLQYHHHRDEYWTVVSGEGLALCNSILSKLSPGVHLYIPQHKIHRIFNLSETQLILMEVQIGECISEYDICRMIYPSQTALLHKRI